MARCIPLTILLAIAGGLTATDVPAPIAVLKGHADPVYAVAFSADASMAATGSFDQTIKLWDADTGRELRTLGGKNGHRDQILTVAFSPDGTLVASGSSDRQVKLWPVPPRTPAETFDLPAAATCVAVTRDDKTYAVGTDKGEIHLFTSADGKPAGRLTGHSGAVTAVAFSPNGQLLVSIGVDNTLRYWDVAKAESRASVDVSKAAVTGLVVASNGTVHTASANGELRTWPSQPPTNDKDELAADEKRKADDPATIGAALAITPNGSHLLTAGTADGVAVRNAGNFTQERTFAVPGRVSAVAVARNNQLVAIGYTAVDGKQPQVTVLRWNDGVEVGTFPTDAAATGLEFHPDSTVLAGTLDGGEAVAWSVTFDANQPLPPTFGRPVQSFTESAGVPGVAFTSKGETVLTAAADKRLHVWAFASDQPVKSFGHPNLVDAVAFDKSGEFLATGCHDGQLRIWEVTTGKSVKTIAAHTKPAAVAIYCVAWSPDAKQIVTGSFDRTAKVWDVKSGNLVREIPAAVDRFPPAPDVRVAAPAVIGAPGSGWLTAPPDLGHRDQVFGVAVGPAGKRLATGSSDRTAVVWDYATGSPACPLANRSLPKPAPGLPHPAHPGFVTAVGFTPDGTKVVTAGPAPQGQGYLAVWSAASGELVAAVVLPHGPVNGLAVRPDGKAVLLGFGPRSRMQTECDAVVLPLPK